MIPFTTAQLPGGIYAPAYVEELLVWAAGVIQFNNPTESYTEAEGTARLFRYIQPQIRIPDGRLMLINRAVIQVDESADQNLPIWKRVKDPANTIIPDGFKISG